MYQNIINYKCFLVKFQVQHRSMMAMMNVLDDPGQIPGVHPPRGNRVQSRGTSPLRGDIEDTQSTMLHSTGRSRRSPDRKENVRGVLTELKNLQQSTGKSGKKKKGSKSPSGTLIEKENASLPLQMSELRGASQDGYPENVEVYRVQHQGSRPLQDGPFIPRFLQLQAERDTNQLHFPHIPVQAWGEHQAPPQPHDDANLPLLQLNSMYGAPNVPPPGSYFPQQPPYPGQSGHQQSKGQFGMPLLSLPKDSDGRFHQPAFGRLLAPDLVIGQEDEEYHQRELVKQRLAHEFHQQQVKSLQCSTQPNFVIPTFLRKRGIFNFNFLSIIWSMQTFCLRNCEAIFWETLSKHQY